MTPDFFPGALLTLRRGPHTLVALDIDGTLMRHDGVITPQVREAVAQLVEEGTHVVLSTGRSITAVLPVIDELGLTSGWAVCSNGAVTVRYDHQGWDVQDVVTFNPGPTLRKLRQQAPDVLFAVEVLGRGFKVTEEFPLGELAGEQERVSFDDICATPASRVTVRAPDLTAQDFHELVERTGLHGVSYAVGWTAWLDISPNGVSKASALDVVRQRLNVDAAKTLAAGDGRNDIEMLGWASYGIAMGEADETTRAAADYVTGPAHADGLVPVLADLAPNRSGAATPSH